MNAARRAWLLRGVTIAYVICGSIFRWWWPAVAIAAFLLVIDAWTCLAREIGRTRDPP